MTIALAVSGSNVTGDVPFSCALRLPGGVVGTRSAPGVRGDLAALVAELCTARAVAPEAVGEIVVDVGPGSYTGLRVAVTFVRFLQRFGPLRVFAVDSLALLAARAAVPGQRVVAVLDARRQRVHRQAFTLQDDRLVSVLAAAAVPLPQLLGELAAGDVVVVPAPLPAELRAPLAAATGVTLRVESAIAAAELFGPALPLVPAGAADLEPRYLMGSYAGE
ncbi:MAG: tRNA (adenosine(37)-N6)-threonylcarbamoyltransferase complex dimerization subunit type 1 TsaB [Planctomycetota bacterium]